MRPEDKKIFDYLNQSSYLLRVLLDKLGFDIQPMHVLNDTVWHVLYRGTVVGTITFRTDEDDFTYCNIRLYKYLKEIHKVSEDFIMSEYYEYDGDKRVRFKFEKFDKYFIVIRDIIDSLRPQEPAAEEQSTIEDSISRLTEYCDEYDQKFSKNMIIHDIMAIIKENERLHAELKKKSDSIIETFIKV